MSGADGAVPFAVPVADVELRQDSGFPGEVLSGEPVMSSAVLWEAAGRAVVRGVWEVRPGRFSWAFGRNETLVVLSGRARVTVADGSVLTLEPGVVAAFPAGQTTVWEVDETLRKVFVVDSAP